MLLGLGPQTSDAFVSKLLGVLDSWKERNIMNTCIYRWVMNIINGVFISPLKSPPEDEDGPMPSWLSCPLSELVGPPWWWLWWGLLPLPVWSFPLSSPPPFRCSAASMDFRCIPTDPQSIRSWLFSKSWLKLLDLDDCADRDGQKNFETL